MLAAGIMNGLVIWIQSIINWFRRVHYQRRGAVCVEATCDVLNSKSNYLQFHFAYEGGEYDARVYEPSASGTVEIPDQEKTPLLWIVGSKRAMIAKYRQDPNSVKAVQICDVLSIAALAVLIASIAAMSYLFRSAGSRDSSMTILLEALFIAPIVVMIVTSVIRKKHRA